MKNRAVYPQHGPIINAHIHGRPHGAHARLVRAAPGTDPPHSMGDRLHAPYRRAIRAGGQTVAGTELYTTARRMTRLRNSSPARRSKRGRPSPTAACRPRRTSLFSASTSAWISMGPQPGLPLPPFLPRRELVALRRDRRFHRPDRRRIEPRRNDRLVGASNNSIKQMMARRQRANKHSLHQLHKYFELVSNATSAASVDP